MKSTMPHMLRAISPLASLVLVTCSLSCSPSSSGPDTYPVTGTVTFENQAVGGAVITFHADSGGLSGIAYTSDDGTFNAITYFENGKQSKSGLVAGEYSVTVVKLQPAPESLPPGTPPTNVLPPKYETAKQSPLKLTVSSETANNCQFDL